MLRKLSLFSGIGGDDLASEWAGIKTVCMVEKNEYCRQVLKKNFPGIPIIEDVKDVKKETLADTTQRKPRKSKTRDGREGTGGGSKIIPDSKKFLGQSGSTRKGERELAETFKGNKFDIIAGGFPCQPHSVAGKRKGSSDERNLWPEFRRIIGLFKPRWVVGENVPGIFSSDGGLFFNGILCDLAEMGYSVGWCTFGAVDVGALHRRNRVFIVAHSGSIESGRLSSKLGQAMAEIGESGEDLANADEQRLQRRERGELPKCTDKWIARTSNPLSNSEFKYDNGWRYGTSAKRQQEQREILGSEYWQSEPVVGRVANGIPHRVDRLRGLGNAVVPQQIYPIYKAIVDIENELRFAQ